MTNREGMIVRLTWGDSVQSEQGWMPGDAVAEYTKKMRENGLLVESVGFIHYEDDDILIICQCVHGHNRLGLMTIPKFAIKDMHILDTDDEDMAPTFHEEFERFLNEIEEETDSPTD